MTTGAQQHPWPESSPPPLAVPELLPLPPDAVPELFPLPPDAVPELFPLPPAEPSFEGAPPPTVIVTAPLLT
jgi:hypothetical protein